MPKNPQVIMFSTSLGKWEIWQAGRPLAMATRRETLEEKFPNALPVSDDQLRIEREYKEVSVNEFEYQTALFQEEVRKGHLAIAELKDLLKEVRRERELIEDMMRRAFEDEIAEKVSEELLEFQETTKKAMDSAVEHIFGEFDKIYKHLTGGTKGQLRKHGATIPELAEKIGESGKNTQDPGPFGKPQWLG